MKCPDFLWIVIPVYNHSETVKGVAEKCLEQSPNVLLINDGSTDADISELVKELNIKVLNHQKNKGKGAALRTGAAYVKEQGGTYIITLDADGQHDPDDITKFLPHISEDCSNIILGTRDFESGNVPERSKFGRKFSNFWIRFETGCDVRDSQSGFRGYPVNLLTDIKCIAEHYAFETEILVRGVWAGMDVVNVNISVYYPEGKKRISHFRPFMDNLRISLLHSRLTAEKALFH